ncbi:CRISPR system precrRNA processing endoribonuclease RAMP protein Cas6 [Calidifontibacillus oryziterrae]|uniref:CRISPR system precrRNA processing endoribonuclease RAMP protein Cas6 n=1 Tax=Calidifontibacillus oryziterrae TaxID=1191699 RepID=UPI00031437EA|nr:CRISPR system precrRNA processing endoribonuclease RAMP protein Cas6 [Calidifontibacillus oryziterrae]
MKNNEELYQYLSKIKIAKFTAIYEAGPNGLELPPFKGSTFRGSFGHAFKEVACTCPNNGNGVSPKHFDHCVYAYVFETSSPEGSEILINNESIPRPFLLEPPNDSKTYFAPGERFTFGFSLFGKGIEYLPYFIYVLDAMGRQGFGRGQKQAELRQVWSVDAYGDLAKPIFSNAQRKVINDFIIVTGEEILTQNCELSGECRIHFASPARLKYDGEFVSNPAFHIVLRSAVRRITSLLYFHHDEPKLNFDFGRLFQQAEKEITCKKSNVEWTSWERYSNRQKQRLKMGGIVGNAAYQGDFEPYLPWLQLAEWSNIGKNPVFGLGKVKFIWKNK